MANTDSIEKEVLQWQGPTTLWGVTEKNMLAESSKAEAENTVAVIAGVVIGVLATMFILFSLALLIDCKNRRKQEALQDQLQQKRKTFPKTKAISQFAQNSHENRENISFANKLFADSQSVPPSADMC